MLSSQEIVSLPTHIHIHGSQMMLRKRQAASQSVSFEEAKHFKWTTTSPKSDSVFPKFVYNLVATSAGGNVVVIARHHLHWPRARVLYYNIRKSSWKVVHEEGPQWGGDGNLFGTTPVVCLCTDRVFLLGAVEPVLYSFDLVLREWTQVELKEVAFRSSSCVRCFLENIQSFIYWDSSKGNRLSVLDVDSSKWSEHRTKGEPPMGILGNSETCYHANLAYIVWSDINQMTDLYILAHRNSSIEFYWSKPLVKRLLPRYAEGASLTYSAGRLFMFGGYQPRLSKKLSIYLTTKGEWQEVSHGSGSDYTVEGDGLATALHSTVALKDKIIFFGGVLLSFRRCRILEVGQSMT